MLCYGSLEDTYMTMTVGFGRYFFFLRHPLCGVSSHLRVVPDTGNDIQMRKINEWIRGFLAVGVIFCSVYTL